MVGQESEEGMLKKSAACIDTQEWIREARRDGWTEEDIEGEITFRERREAGWIGRK